MISNIKTFAALAFAITALNTRLPAAEVPSPDWQATLKAELPRMGHRNFIVIADSAYPLQSAPGIRTIATGGNQLDVITTVLGEIRKAKHVSPIIHIDSELDHVTEAAAPGIGEYRKGLAAALADAQPSKLPHMEIIKKLDASAELFNVLILKTDLALPYTSVFIELDCGYWSAEKEAALRKAIGEAK
jgi:L-fucose mutarotase/ribose pyranase (RbsD/FucU family)